MSKLTIILLVSILISTILVLPVLAAPISIETYQGTPTVDGAKDEIYNYTPTYPIENYKDGADAGGKGSLNALWNSSTLYIYIESYDTTPWTDALEQSYLADCIEYFIDINNKRLDTFEYDDFTYIQLRIDNVGNVSGNNTGNSWALQPEVTDNVKFAIRNLNGKDLSGGYAIEMAFDIKAFGSLSEGKVIGFDIQIADVQGDSSTRAGQAFLGNSEKALLDTQYNIPTSLGANIILKGAVPVPAADTPATEAPATDAAAPVVVTTPAAQTADVAGISVLTAVIALAGITVISKRKA